MSHDEPSPWYNHFPWNTNFSISALATMQITGLVSGTLIIRPKTTFPLFNGQDQKLEEHLTVHNFMIFSTSPGTFLI